MEKSARSTDRSANRKKRANKRAAYRQHTQNRLSMVLISMVVILIMVVVVVGSLDVKKKIQEKSAQEQKLDTQIMMEEERAREIEELEKEVQTKGWVENEAREKLGLVYEDEILFKQE